MRRLDAWLARWWPAELAAGRAHWHSLRSGLTNWGFVLAGLLGAQALNALSLIVVARRVLPTDYGQYVACLSLASLLVIFPAFGMDSWLLAQGVSAPERVAALWRGALKVRLPLLGAWLGGLLLLGLVLPQESYPLPLLMPMAIDVAADSTLLITFAALRLLGRHRQVAGLQVGAAILVLVAALWLPVAPGRILIFALGQMVVAILVALLAIAAAARWLRGPAEARPARALLQGAQSFMLSDLAAVIYGRSGLTLTALLVGASGAGALGPALNVLGMAFLVPAAMYALMLPVLSRAWAAARHHQFWRVGGLQLFAQAAAGVALSAAIYFLSPPLIRGLFAGRYDAAIPILQLLSPIAGLKSINFGLGACLTGSQHQARRTAVQYVAALVSVVAGVVAIASLGVPGAASVEVLTEVVLTLGYGAAVLVIWRSSRPAPVRP